MPKQKVLISKVPVSPVPTVPKVPVSPVPTVPKVPVPTVPTVPKVPVFPVVPLFPTVPTVPKVPVPPVPTMEYYRPAKTTSKGAQPEVHIVYTHTEIAQYMGIPVGIFSNMPMHIRVANMEKYHKSLQYRQSPGGRHPLFSVLKKYIPIGTPVTPVSFAAALEKVRTEIISLAKNENLREELMKGITESRESDRKSNKKTKKTDE